VCPYCDFSVVIAGEERRSAYLRALEVEAAGYSKCGLSFDTVYLGGGTPSCLDLAQLAEIVATLRDKLDLVSGCRWYLELNPEDVTAERSRGWQQLGFDSVSLGVQSFDDVVLGALGRRHTAAQARLALERLRSAAFRTLSIDLIYGIEGQTAEAWKAQLDEAVELEPDHLSCYQLTVHPGTVFGRRLERREMAELPSREHAELFFLTHARLADEGYDAYELSNFAARSEHRSRHNIKYWRHVPYLGLGPSAHSFAGGRRWWNIRKPRLWRRALDDGRLPVDGLEVLSGAQLALEALILGLRTREGVDLATVRTRFGIDLIRPNTPTIERLCEQGFVVLEGDMLRPTTTGMAIADTLARSIEVPTATQPP
jgi:oxygen-independent coproporphyrinogen-3 oxidase